ncbi:MAG TPA: Na+/H+ antiporter subunit E [Rhizorhapis sp.]
MSRWFPHPLLMLSLIILWFLLQQTFSLGHLLLGTAIAFFASRGMMALRPEKVRIRFSSAIPRLALIVLTDIIRSNIAVGRIIIARGNRHRTSGFILLPLDLRNRYGLAVLGIIITATPGTLWMQYDSARSVLLVHVLDLVDEAAWIRLIKQRYERLLMDIFE